MRAILHSDMNSYYASVEMMLNPALRGKAVAVCGSTENRHGIVLAKSELAKRFLKTGMLIGRRRGVTTTSSWCRPITCSITSILACKIHLREIHRPNCAVRMLNVVGYYGSSSMEALSP